MPELPINCKSGLDALFTNVSDAYHLINIYTKNVWKKLKKIFHEVYLKYNREDNEVII